MTTGTINDANKTWSWTLPLFWILVPLTIACGVWDLGVWSVFAHVCSILITATYCIVTGFRTMDRLGHFDRAVLAYTWKKALWSYVQGFSWGAAMIFAWPGAWVGPIYLILLIINFCLLELKRRKKVNMVKAKTAFVVSEGIEGRWNYHISRSDEAISLCGKTTMSTNIPLTAWNKTPKDYHLPETWCNECEKMISE